MGIAVNSSQITSGGSFFPRSISARVQSGIPKINNAKNNIIIPSDGMEVAQNRKVKTSNPINDPKVPGAGKLVPTGPRVDKVLIKKSFTCLLQ